MPASSISVQEAEARLRQAAQELEDARSRSQLLRELPATTEEALTNALAALTVAENAERHSPHDVTHIVRALSDAVRMLITFERDRAASVAPPESDGFVDASAPTGE